jgi:hypothetical protein
MAQVDRLLVKDEQGSDLASFSWDDRLFSDLLARSNCVNTAQAMDISRSLMEEIRKREIESITVPLLERIIEDKLKEYGISKTDPVRLDSSLFVRKAKLVLSENARTVLERRYLRKDLSGQTHRQSGKGLRRRIPCQEDGRGLPCHDDRIQIPAQFSDADECRPEARAARRLFRAACRGQHGRDL